MLHQPEPQQRLSLPPLHTGVRPRCEPIVLMTCVWGGEERKLQLKSGVLCLFFGCEEPN